MRNYIIFIVLTNLFDINLINCGVVDKPGFDRHIKISVNGLNHYDELSRHTHLNDAIEFVGQQKVKTSDLNKNTAKNAILFLGDGMSMPVLTASRIYVGGEKSSLSFEEFPFVAMSKTYCVDKNVADSACSATGNRFFYCFYSMFN